MFSNPSTSFSHNFDVNFIRKKKIFSVILIYYKKIEIFYLFFFIKITDFFRKVTKARTLGPFYDSFTENRPKLKLNCIKKMENHHLMYFLLHNPVLKFHSILSKTVYRNESGNSTCPTRKMCFETTPERSQSSI